MTQQTTQIDGKPYYQGTGSVPGNPGVDINIYWLTPDNLWVLAYDGQPFFSNATNSPLPPPTTSSTWDLVPGNPSVGSTPISITGDGTLAVKLSEFTATIIHNNALLKY